MFWELSHVTVSGETRGNKPKIPYLCIIPIELTVYKQNRNYDVMDLKLSRREPGPLKTCRRDFITDSEGEAKVCFPKVLRRKNGDTQH